MKEIIAQLRLALNTEAYYPALFLCFSLPDICAAMESIDGQASGAKYKAWFDKYVAKNYIEDRFTGEYAYIIRCSLLHQGKLVQTRLPYNKILFQTPDQRNQNVIHSTLFGKDFVLNVICFCEEVISGVEEWLTLVENDPNFILNNQRTVNLHGNGIKDYWELPFIA